MKQKLLIFTDTFDAQINGVKISIQALIMHLGKDYEVTVISGDNFPSIPFPTYNEILFPIASPGKIKNILKKIRPHMIHIATEGSLGFMASRVCRKLRIPYSSAFHTNFPVYISLRAPFIKEKYVHNILQHLHNRADKIIVSNNFIATYLGENGYTSKKIVIAPFGVDHNVFSPGEKTMFQELQKPILLFVGRIAIEKNIKDFLHMKTSGTKIVVGDGPLKKDLQASFPNTHFLGSKTKQELAEIYRSSDVFIFPSLTDTLGLVNIEALACGIPVISYNTPGPSSIIEHGKDGFLVPYGQLLESQITAAMQLKKENCILKAHRYTWESYSKKFLAAQTIIPKETWI